MGIAYECCHSYFTVLNFVYTMLYTQYIMQAIVDVMAVLANHVARKPLPNANNSNNNITSKASSKVSKAESVVAPLLLTGEVDVTDGEKRVSVNGTDNPAPSGTSINSAAVSKSNKSGGKGDNKSEKSSVVALTAEEKKAALIEVKA